MVECHLIGPHVKEHVFIKGFRSDTGEIISNFDFLVLPSIEYESFGLVVLEGWKYKIPTVAFKTGGVVEVINHLENGVLVEPKDIDGLAKECIRLLNNPETTRKLGENGYNKLQQEFTSVEMAKKYAALIRA